MIERFDNPFAGLRPNQRVIQPADLLWVDDDHAERLKGFYTQAADGWRLSIPALLRTHYEFRVGLCDAGWEMVEAREKIAGTIGEPPTGLMELVSAQMFDAMLPRLLGLLDAAWRRLPVRARRNLRL